MIVAPAAIVEVKVEKSKICEQILRTLPDWFRIEESIQDDVKGVEQMQRLGAKFGDEISAFLALKKHNATHLEIYVMAVRPEHHGKGLGTLLLSAAEESSQAKGFS